MSDLPSPDTLSSPERMEHIMQLRRRQLAGESIPTEELRWALSLLRAERTSRRQTGKQQAAGKLPKNAAALEDI